jgi:DNA-nicking Smr family endonuclease
VGLSKEDRHAFEEATRGVKPLKRDDRVPSHRPRPQARAIQSRAEREAILEETLNGTYDPSDAAFRRPEVSARMLRKLRRGDFSIADEIDLHGLRRDEAKAALKAFLADSVASGHGCVRVIHGKGTRSGPDGPVLKSSVPDWLARCNDVLAFVSASRRHGGSGAVCVLLRRR